MRVRWIIWFDEEFIEKFPNFPLVFKDEFRFLVDEGKNLLSGSFGMRWAFVSVGIGRGFCLEDEVSSTSNRL
jgi:hypothetical protein